MSTGTPNAAAQPRTRRMVELGLLVLAVLVVSGAYVATGLGAIGTPPTDVLTHAGTLLALALVAHLAVRRWARWADPLLLPVVVLLNGMGLVLIYRVDLAESERARLLQQTVPSADAPVQLVWMGLGVALFVALLFAVRDHRTLQRYTYTAMAAGFLLLLLPLLPGIGAEINGARIWIRLAGFSFQPAEIAKLALIVFFAGYLVVKRDVLALASRRFAGIDFPRGRDLGPILVAWLVSLGVLIFQRDLGTSVLFFGVFVALLYIATERLSWVILGGLLLATGGFFAYTMFDHVQTRVQVWLDPFADADGAGYQIVQSLFGLAAGGILGTGLGQGQPETVPYAKTDFIVATAGEELGLTGLMALLLLYAIVVERGVRSALAVRDSFGKLLAAGLSVIFAIQCFVVVGGVTKLIPLTGLTMPFLSYGGSSLVANWALLALLLRVSDGARRPAPAPAPPPDEARTQVVRL